MGNPERKKLPTRRPLLNTKAKFYLGGGDQSSTVYIGIGFDDAGVVKEVFFDGGFKQGSTMEANLKDACILVSHMLQYGMPIEEVTELFTEAEDYNRENYKPSIFGVLFDLIDKSNRGILEEQSSK